jgi:hypothetical protein
MNIAEFTLLLKQKDITVTTFTSAASRHREKFSKWFVLRANYPITYVTINFLEDTQRLSVGPETKK